MNNLSCKCKYGPNGLLLVIYSVNRSKKLNEILLTKDNRKIFEFLGFDYDVYLNEFHYIEDIFDWTINSKFFNSKLFQFDNLNAIDRKRSKKRKSYNDFLNYITNIKSKPDLEIDTLKRINSFFPEVKIKKILEECKRQDKEIQEMKSKFNGDLVMQWIPGLKGKELGIVIGNFMKSKKNWNQYILNTKSDKIKEDFILWY